MFVNLMIVFCVYDQQKKKVNNNNNSRRNNPINRTGRDVVYGEVE